MKVVAILGGLGSQMFKYSFYLMLKKKTKDECFIDTTYYLQNNSWNGYELEKIFGIHDSDYLHLLNTRERNTVLSKKRHYISVVLHHMLNSENNHIKVDYYFLGHRQRIRLEMFEIQDVIRMVLHKYYMGFGKYSNYSRDSFNSRNAYYDEYPHNSDKYIRRIKNQLLEVFQFPEFEEDLNRIKALEINESNSVAIHVRRTDHLRDNKKLFERGYYSKSVQYIKESNDNDLKYFIFSDDMNWCKNNKDQLGLCDFDDVQYVDWNDDENSFRDMQLMTYCKHNVLAISSFSWWGYYLSRRENKIVCSPDGYWLEVPVHF